MGSDTCPMGPLLLGRIGKTLGWAVFSGTALKLFDARAFKFSSPTMLCILARGKGGSARAVAKSPRVKSISQIFPLLCETAHPIGILLAERFRYLYSVYQMLLERA